MSTSPHLKWSKPYDSNTRPTGFSGHGQDSWLTLSLALRDLHLFAQDMEFQAQRMHESNFDPVVCSSAMEMWIEPPADHIGMGSDTAAYAEIYGYLQTLTEQGYDVRAYWQDFQDSIRKIWRALPDFQQGQRVDVVSDYDQWKLSLTEGVPVSWITDTEKDFREKLELTQLPPNYDPTKPFPQYPIPLDIDEPVEKE